MVELIPVAEAIPGVIKLSIWDLSLSSLLILLLAFLSFRMRLGVQAQILIAALRTTVQLLLVGLVLHVLFRNVSLLWVLLMSMVMLLAAGREVVQRQRHRLTGVWGFGVGISAMFVSAFSVTLFALWVLIGVKPWYTPQYAIPLLGMLLGNTMTGVAIGLDRLTQSVWTHRAVIENRLMLGEPWSVAISDLRADAIRTGMIPIINAMAAAGIVSLPGMMTGQIMAGTDPVDAVKYQIMIMFLVSAGTGFGTYCAVWLASIHLCDERQRLRLDRLHIKE